MKILLIDNYDSFTYNLVHYLEQLDCSVEVVRNDEPALEKFSAVEFDGLVLSPGPGLPKESGHLMKVIEQNFGKISILGVCLGMQALAEHTGGALYNRAGVMHGRSATLQKRNESILLKGVENLEVGLYHSWAVQPDLLNEWNLCAVALDDEAPMVIEQPKNMAYAVQFHPESVLTPEGLKMIANWVQTLR